MEVTGEGDNAPVRVEVILKSTYWAEPQASPIEVPYAAYGQIAFAGSAPYQGLDVPIDLVRLKAEDLPPSARLMRGLSAIVVLGSAPGELTV